MNKNDPEEKDDLCLAYAMFLKEIGEFSREGLKETPKRAAETLRYLTSGYQVDMASLMQEALFISSARNMVIIKDIEFSSLCEHHLLPFFGKCHIGYLPKGKIFGLSKVAKVVEIIAKRLQTQESLTEQIAENILRISDAYGVGVVMEASHLCTRIRGAEKSSLQLVTSAWLGTFEEESIRKEFLMLIGRS